MPSPRGRVTTRALLELLAQTVERIAELERLLTDRLEPLANQSRHELGRRIALLERRLTDLETWAENWNGGEGDEWKRGRP